MNTCCTLKMALFMSITSPEQDAGQCLFQEPNTKTSVPEAALLQRLMLGGM